VHSKISSSLTSSQQESSGTLHRFPSQGDEWWSWGSDWHSEGHEEQCDDLSALEFGSWLEQVFCKEHSKGLPLMVVEQHWVFCEPHAMDSHILGAAFLEQHCSFDSLEQCWLVDWHLPLWQWHENSPRNLWPCPWLPRRSSMLLKITIKHVATSTRTASHTRGCPANAKARTPALVATEKMMFWMTLWRVLLASFMAFGIFLMSFDIRMTCPVSVASAEPDTPIEIPTSAVANAGASLTPSPTMAVIPSGL